MKRADSDLNQQSILREFVQGIVEADLVIADLTGLNGNVMYELGLAHALGARVILLTQNIAELPFDLRTYKANPYSTHFDEAESLKSVLRSMGEATLAGSAEYGNPIQDFSPEALRSNAPVRVKLKSHGQSGDKGPAPGGEGTGTDPPREDGEAPGFIEAVVELEQLTHELTSLSESVAERTQQMGESIEGYSGKMQNAQNRLGQKSMPAIQAIINQMVGELERYNADLSPRVNEFQDVFARYGSSVEVISKEVVVTSDDDVEAANRTLAVMLESETSFDEAVQGMRGFSAMMADAPNATKKLRTAARGQQKW